MFEFCVYNYIYNVILYVLCKFLFEFIFLRKIILNFSIFNVCKILEMDRLNLSKIVELFINIYNQLENNCHSRNII
jgi:hypothetical protein